MSQTRWRILFLVICICFGWIACAQAGGLPVDPATAAQATFTPPPQPTSAAASPVATPVLSPSPTQAATAAPTATPSIAPTPTPTPQPTFTPTPKPTLVPTPRPTPQPTFTPTPKPTLVPTPKPTPTPTPMPTRYELLLTPRADVLPLGQALTLEIDGAQIQVRNGEALALPFDPGDSIALSLPQDTPFQVASSADFAQARGLRNGYTLTLAAERFEPASPDSKGAPRAVAEISLKLEPIAQLPEINLITPEGPLEVGRAVQQTLLLTNRSLLPQEVEVRYRPDSARFLLPSLQAAQSEELLADGTMCWTRTLPAASWTEKGGLVPSELRLPFALTVQPLPTDAPGFADASSTYSLRWQNITAEHTWRAEIVAPRVYAQLSADTGRIAVGESVNMTVQLTNQGGAAKRVIVSTVLPSGFRYRPIEGAQQPEFSGDMLLWQVDLPAAERPDAGKATVPVQRALTYSLQIESAAMDDAKGWRRVALHGWVDGVRMPSLPIELVSPQIIATQTLSAPEATAGDVLTLHTVFENIGGAEGIVPWILTLPEGVEYLPPQQGEDPFPPSTDANGRLHWEVAVPPAADETDAESHPGVFEHSIQVVLGDALAGDQTGGRRTLHWGASVGQETLPEQTLDVLCPDVSVQVIAEKPVISPGATCLMTLRVRNSGLADAPVTVEAVIPEGFSLAKGDATGQSGMVVRGRTLSWQFELPAAHAGEPATVDLHYPLQANALPSGVRESTMTQSALYTTGDAEPREAVSTSLRVERDGLFDLDASDLWAIIPLAVLMVAVIVVFILLLRKS